MFQKSLWAVFWFIQTKLKEGIFIGPNIRKIRSQFEETIEAREKAAWKSFEFFVRKPEAIEKKGLLKTS